MRRASADAWIISGLVFLRLMLAIGALTMTLETTSTKPTIRHQSLGQLEIFLHSVVDGTDFRPHLIGANLKKR